jgi:transposase
MSKRFVPWDVDQVSLFPPSVLDYVPLSHSAHFVRDLVRDELDLEAVYASYDDARGAPAFHPAMMTALLLYAYTQGIYSSRRISRACEERLDFHAVTASSKPDFRTIAEFRKRHLKALSGLFVQVLKLCAKAGLVKLGHVALDGTKIKANASKNKAMSYARMQKAEVALAAEVAGWLKAAEAADRKDNTSLGADRRGDEMPDWVADKQKRLTKIREAKAALEAEAKAKAEARAKAKDDNDDRGDGPRPGRKPKHPPGTPKPKAQRNFTDPDSRIMPAKDGFIQAYNGQVAVDATAQVIVAHSLSNSSADSPCLIPLTDAVTQNMGGKKAKEISADAGYCSEANLAGLKAREISAYIATGQAKRPTTGGKVGGPLTQIMRRKLKLGGHRSRYRLRKQLPEPVFGQIKQARGFRQFLLRGLDKVQDEWGLVCIAHNITKLFAAA